MLLLLSLAMYVIQVFLPFLGLIIIYSCFKSIKVGIRERRPLLMLVNKRTREKMPVMFWENSIGRNKSSDIVLDFMSVSRNHAVIFRRNEGWFIRDTNSKTGTYVNGSEVEKRVRVNINDVINIGGIDLVLKTAEKNREKERENLFKNSKSFYISSGSLLFLVIVFHFFASVTACFNSQLFLEPIIALLSVSSIGIISFTAVKYFFKQVNFEVETIGLFLSGIGIITLSTVDIHAVYIQSIAMIIGIVVFYFMIMFMKDPDKAMKFRLVAMVLAIFLFSLNIIFGKIKNGAQNWIDFYGFSLQPSEFIKVAFVFVGASTLEHLQTAKNITGFILFSLFCIVSLFIIGDFGTACIFFFTFLVIAFLRSGSIKTMMLFIVSAILGGFMVAYFKPYIVQRFSVWRHVWENANDLGYQQTRVLSYLASGGLFGIGIGKGYLKNVFASSSDLMFGVICEEWGILIGLTVAVCILSICFVARKFGFTSRSSFYFIASCAASSMLVFQMSLNVFGSTDILPLTGVTLPFVSLGGSSMVCVWGLLAFIKISDERTYAVRGEEKT